MGRLSATTVKAATRPGRLGDGDGLYLVVTGSGTKSWMVRVQKHGTRRDFGLGSASKVSLAVARERAREIRAWVELGLDPLFERRKAQGVPTFRKATAKVLAQHRKTWRNEKHEGQWLRTLQPYAIEPITIRVPDACRYIGVSRSTLYVLIAGGEIEIVKLGCSTLVLIESLKALIAKRRGMSEVCSNQTGV